MLNIYLYAGEANPCSVRLSDPTVPRGGPTTVLLASEPHLHLEGAGAISLLVPLSAGAFLELDGAGELVVRSSVFLACESHLHLEGAGGIGVAVGLACASHLHLEGSGDPVIKINLELACTSHLHLDGAAILDLKVSLSGVSHLHLEGLGGLIPTAYLSGGSAFELEGSGLIETILYLSGGSALELEGEGDLGLAGIYGELMLVGVGAIKVLLPALPATRILPQYYDGGASDTIDDRADYSDISAAGGLSKVPAVRHTGLVKIL